MGIHRRNAKHREYISSGWYVDTRVPTLKFLKKTRTPDPGFDINAVF